MDELAPALDSAGSWTPGSTASAAPLSLGVLAFALSLVLAVITTTQLDYAGGVPLARPWTWPMSLAGLVLTPVTAIIAGVWDHFQQLGDARRDHGFMPRPAYQAGLRTFAFAGLAPTAWHIANLAAALAASEGAVP